jgi:hypothetical protein
MTHENAETTAIEPQELIATGGGPETLDGHDSGGVQDTMQERPELLIGGAFLGGLRLGALVSRLGR